MKVDIEFNKRSLIPTAFFLILSIVAWAFVKYEAWIIPIFLFLFLLLGNIKIQLSEKLPWLWAGIMLAGGAALTMYSIQYLLLEWELFQKTSDDNLFLNAVCCLVIYLVFQLVTGNTSLACIISHSGLMLFGAINFFVYGFRGNEFSFSDISSAFTGFSVASKYSFSINDRFVYVVMVSIIYFMLLAKLTVRFRKPWQMRIINVLLIVICCLTVSTSSVCMITETWEQKGSYRNGYLLNFLLEIRDSHISEPEDYSVDVVTGLEKQYATSSETETSEKKPTIIVIMSESYADLEVLGQFSTNMKVTPFTDSLEENTVKGYAISSVYGAKTPNSEWEYLTGNSMAFLPDGSVPYQQYMDDQPYTLISTLKDNDYTCVAMHPYYETGWNRSTLYPRFGYDETYFIDDFNQDNIIREYITDQEMFDKVIDRYEQKKDDENLFIMGITMQNHGGYGEEYDNFDQEIYKIGRSYTDANQYLSLLHESDKAMKNLITYFQNQDEPVEIVFFGDHQPGLYSEFIKILNGKGVSGLTTDELMNLYKVPFFIWTNYEIEEKEIDVTSLNYLSTLTLSYADIELPAYNRFAADMMEAIPAMNARGFYSKEKNKFIHYDEATGEEAQWLENYQILQYNCMFDEKKRSKLFFPYYGGDN